MERYKRFIIFSITFFIGGILHVVLREVDFTACFSPLFYGVMVLVWWMLVKDQIIDQRVRLLVRGIVLFLEMYFLLQICRYRLTDGNSRFFWYSYYIPMIVIPLLFFYITIYMNRQKNDVPNRRIFLVSVPALVLIPLIMTNDYHQLFIRLGDNLVDSIVSSNAGILVYLYRFYSISLLVVAFILLFYKCQISISKQKIFQLIIILCANLVLFVSYATGLGPKINGVKLWEIGEIFAIVTIYVLEACMQVGLISVNTKYTWIFQEMDLPAVIQDSNGKNVYLTKGANAVLNPSNESLVKTANISGGSVSWAVDLSAINELNRQIAATIDQIEARNRTLTIQNTIREETAAVDARSKVYDRIARKVSSQLGEIEELLSLEEQDFSQRLRKIVVYNAYIKRRSNLELLRENEKIVPIEELCTAIFESIGYLKLNLIDANLICTVDGNMSANACILAYEFFETVAEAVLNRASMLAINLTEKDKRLSLRILADITNYSFMDKWNCEEFEKCCGEITKIDDNKDSILVLSFDRGGVN